MGNSELRQIAVTLLQGGVAFRHVKRFIAELRDHSADIEAEAVGNGSDAASARGEAAARLGEPEVLMQEMLQRPELKSYGWRYPRLLLVLGPVLGVILLSALLVFLTIGSISLINLVFRGDAMADEIIAMPAMAIILFDGVRIFWMYILPCLIVMVVVSYAEKNLIPLKYYGTGLLVACILASSLFVYLIWPDPVTSSQGAFNVSVSIFRGSFPVESIVRLASCMAVALVTKSIVAKNMSREFA